jgi:hypothetical protein
MISSTMLKINNVFRTAYYRLILLPTFESADMVAKVKQKIGSETTVRLRSGNFFMASPRYANRALRDTAFLFGLRPADANGDEQDAIAAPLSSDAQ